MKYSPWINYAIANYHLFIENLLDQLSLSLYEYLSCTKVDPNPIELVKRYREKKKQNNLW